MLPSWRKKPSPSRIKEENEALSKRFLLWLHPETPSVRQTQGRSRPDFKTLSYPAYSSSSRNSSSNSSSSNGGKSKPSKRRIEAVVPCHWRLISSTPVTRTRIRTESVVMATLKLHRGKSLETQCRIANANRQWVVKGRQAGLNLNQR